MERWFDHVMVHGDPDFIPLDRTFPHAARIADRLHAEGIGPDDLASAKAYMKGQTPYDYETAADLGAVDALRTVADGHALSREISHLLSDTDARLKLITAQKGVLDEKAEILDLVMTALKPYLRRRRG